MFDLYVKAQRAVHTKDQNHMADVYEEIRGELWKAARERDELISAGKDWRHLIDRLEDASKGLNFLGEHLRAKTMIWNGVLIPEEMQRSTDAELDAYTAKVKADNAAFIRRCWEIEEEAKRRGVELPA